MYKKEFRLSFLKRVYYNFSCFKKKGGNSRLLVSEMKALVKWNNILAVLEIKYKKMDKNRILCYTICIEVMKMSTYIHARTCVYNINYHIVWCVKYRRKVLTPKIAERFYELVKKIGEEKGFLVVECKVGEGDHVYCFVSASPKISVTQIVKYLKGISGNQLLKEFPELRKQLWKGHLWNGSYFCETIGSTSEENRKKYIERQKNCQL